MSPCLASFFFPEVLGHQQIVGCQIPPFWLILENPFATTFGSQIFLQHFFLSPDAFQESLRVPRRLRDRPVLLRRRPGPVQPGEGREDEEVVREHGEEQEGKVYAEEANRLQFNVGPVTRRSCIKTRRDRLDLVSSRDFVSRGRLEQNILSRRKKITKISIFGSKFWVKFCPLCTWFRISSRLVSFGLETNWTRPSRVSSRDLPSRSRLVS